MTSLLGRIMGGQRSISTIDDYANLVNQFTFNGMNYGLGYGSGIQQTLAGRTTEIAPNNFAGLATHAYQANGVVFACMLVRQLVFSSIRFRWQQIRDGQPSEMFGNPNLALLEQPWTGGTTQDLLSRLINDADLAGNSYWYKDTSLPGWAPRSPIVSSFGCGRTGWTSSSSRAWSAAGKSAGTSSDSSTPRAAPRQRPGRIHR
jgi:hypothetical protein